MYQAMVGSWHVELLTYLAGSYIVCSHERAAY